MKVQISQGIRVYITKDEYQFFLNMRDKLPFLLKNVPVEQQAIAVRLGDKAIFVRKKLATTTQYNLNNNIRFLYEQK